MILDIGIGFVLICDKCQQPQNRFTNDEEMMFKDLQLAELYKEIWWEGQDICPDCQK